MKVAVVWLAVIAAPVVPAIAQSEFPYDRDLMLDSRAMRGGKRVPVLSIEQNGRAQIDLWCKRGDGQAVIAGDTITIIVGAMKDESCTPERAQADADMLAALAGVTNWSARGNAVTLNGATTLRFRAATN
ncbi:MAG TPA: META domain-containing protein [Xanthobacteraceae bacterium]|nr:META domain-containing protein [Xanthobacteraceae bacterium]